MSILHKLPRPKLCCCCIDLRPAAIILSVLGALGHILSAFRTFPMATNFKILENELQAAGVSPEAIDVVTIVTIPIVIYTFVNSLAGLFLAAVLVVGAIKRDKELLAIYIYNNLFNVGVFTVVGILALFVVPVLSIFLGVLLAVVLYYLFCINSYYLLLDEEQNRTQPPPPPDDNKSAV